MLSLFLSLSRLEGHRVHFRINKTQKRPTDDTNHNSTTHMKRQVLHRLVQSTKTSNGPLIVLGLQASVLGNGAALILRLSDTGIYLASTPAAPLQVPPLCASDAGGPTVSDGGRPPQVKVDSSRNWVGRGFAASVGSRPPSVRGAPLWRHVPLPLPAQACRVRSSPRWFQSEKFTRFVSDRTCGTSCARARPSRPLGPGSVQRAYYARCTGPGPT